jgi:hypothetical protein
MDAAVCSDAFFADACLQMLEAEAAEKETQRADCEKASGDKLVEKETEKTSTEETLDQHAIGAAAAAIAAFDENQPKELATTTCYAETKEKISTKKTVTFDDQLPKLKLPGPLVVPVGFMGISRIAASIQVQRMEKPFEAWDRGGKVLEADIVGESGGKEENREMRAAKTFVLSFSILSYCALYLLALDLVGL